MFTGRPHPQLSLRPQRRRPSTALEPRRLSSPGCAPLVVCISSKRRLLLSVHDGRSGGGIQGAASGKIGDACRGTDRGKPAGECSAYMVHCGTPCRMSACRSRMCQLACGARENRGDSFHHGSPPETFIGSIPAPLLPASTPVQDQTGARRGKGGCNPGHVTPLMKQPTAGSPEASTQQEPYTSGKREIACLPTAQAGGAAVDPAVRVALAGSHHKQG